ncbi:hypothetical protein ISS07_03745 [Candidatus Woesearchaeota archaeon]|nr:hypothetical protein [Candidatus Woesearchaeota archaeon]
MKTGHSNKGQAALEFLTTYAWAFLVILIMIGALAYFGVLSPSKLLPDRCNFGTEINCVDFGATFGNGNAGTINLRLKNSVGDAIIIADPATDIVATTEASTALSCSGRTLTGWSSGAYTWNTDTLIDVSLTGCNTAAVGFTASQKGKVLFTLDYYLAKSSATYTRQVAGEIFVTVT